MVCNSFASQEAPTADLKIRTRAASLSDYETSLKGTAHAKEGSSGLCIGGYGHGRECLRRASSSSAVLGADRHRVFHPGGAHEDADARRVCAEVDRIFAAALKAARNPASLDPYHQIVLLGTLALYDKSLSIDENPASAVMSYQGHRFYGRCLAIQSDDCRASRLGGGPRRRAAGSPKVI